MNELTKRAAALEKLQNAENHLFALTYGGELADWDAVNILRNRQQSVCEDIRSIVGAR